MSIVFFCFMLHSYVFGWDDTIFFFKLKTIDFPGTVTKQVYLHKWKRAEREIILFTLFFNIKKNKKMYFYAILKCPAAIRWLTTSVKFHMIRCKTTDQRFFFLRRRREIPASRKRSTSSFVVDSLTFSIFIQQMFFARAMWWYVPERFLSITLIVYGIFKIST